MCHVHEALLVQYSEYFKRALNGRWKETEDRVVRLDDVDSDTFDKFVEWLYTQRPPFPQKRGSEYLTEDETADAQILRIKLCMFSDRFQCPHLTRCLRRHITNQLMYYEPIYPRTITFAFDRLKEDDILLKLLVDESCLGLKFGLRDTGHL
ncbi:hypothetical protein N0V86_005926 [Didymella sp. IMI 355093]|nr:hypothetical protein N0V86_005926 [Didymella sp. IMI 355093]